ncbi:MAG: polyhydroxyalkanoic acid system family protein [Sphingomonadaceae bacterium]
MRVAIPHDLDRAVVRERLKSRSHEIVDHVPGGMAEVETSWPSEDHMAMTIKAMGQELTGGIAIGDTELVIELALPGMVSFMEPMIAGAIRTQGEKLIAKG